MCLFDYDSGTAENATALQHKKKGRAYEKARPSSGASIREELDAVLKGLTWRLL